MVMARIMWLWHKITQGSLDVYDIVNPVQVVSSYSFERATLAGQTVLVLLDRRLQNHYYS